MMWRALLFFLGVALAAGAAVWVADRPGLIAIDWQGYRFETSFAVMIAGLVAFAAIIWAVAPQLSRRRSAAAARPPR